MRIAVSLLLGGITGGIIGFMLKDPKQGVLIGLLMGGVYGFFFDKPDEKK